MNDFKWSDFKWSESMTADILGYKSPIEIITSEVEAKMEGDIMTAIQRYGINVDKEELLKALRYDRDQYAKGYADAKNDLAGAIHAQKIVSFLESRPCVCCCYESEMLNVIEWAERVMARMEADEE